MNNYKNDTEKKKIKQPEYIFKLCLFSIIYIWISILIIFLLLPFCFVVIHELSHAIVAKMVGCEVYEIIIEYPGTSKVIYSEGTPEQGRLISIAGTLGSFTIAFTLNRIVYHKKKIHYLVFLPLYFGTWFWLLYELLRWATDPLKYSGDAGVFLYYTPGISATILSSFFYWILYIVVFWFLINFLKKIDFFFKRSSMWTKFQNRVRSLL